MHFLEQLAKGIRVKFTKESMIRLVNHFLIFLEEEVAIKVIDMKMLKGEVHKNLLAAEIDILKGLRRS